MGVFRALYQKRRRDRHDGYGLLYNGWLPVLGDREVEKDMIQIKNVSKAFGNKQVLNGVSFSVSKKCIYGLVGHNGAGKTTLMSIVSGLIQADAGQCVVEGKGAAYLPDVPSFFDYLTCGEYLDFLLSGRRSNVHVKKNTILEMVELPAKTKIGSMSRGMKQRLGIGAVLANDADALLLDEPTSALDPEGRGKLLTILDRLRGEGKAVILSTHILTDMEKICDKVGFLHGGNIKREVWVDELRDMDAWVVRLGEPVDMESLKGAGFSIELSDINTVIARIDKSQGIKGQKGLLNSLGALDNKIISIHNASKTLYGIFQEVCES